ncbi:hypothetical protein CK203_106896 [Vitis vinifera]|uniref:Retrotransposon gag domain-containing protein n=1 Tax=Vitis vinifera TaxID=29760 RepID=A0A438C4J2_VITVI|nr:hypothetical protein CK203_106896 [Vitis vinifera]
MRDHMHPPRMSAPSCIVPPTEQLVIRPHIVPLLPTFHGMESKIWLNSLRPRSIRTWTDLQAEFLKKFFPTHRTNGLKRQISNFSAKENEKFYECWKDTWKPSMLVLTMVLIHGYWDFMSKNPEEAMDFLSYVAEVSRGWDEPNKGEDKRLEELELKMMHEVQDVAETPVQVKPCSICQSYEHLVEECPIIPVAREMFGDQANVRDVKALITLRSGKKVELPTPKPHVEEKEEEETKKREKSKERRKISVKGKRTMIQQ